jgi:hypothetical protein
MINTYFSRVSESEFWQANKNRSIKVSGEALSRELDISDKNNLSIDNCISWLNFKLGINSFEVIIKKPGLTPSRRGFAPGHYNVVEFRFTPDAYSIVLLSGLFDELTIR